MNDQIHPAVALAQSLIRMESVSGEKDPGALAIIKESLEALGFECHWLTFSDRGNYSVDNLYATLGSEGPNLCFAGHVDVVPAGEGWTEDPFGGAIIQGNLFGRGAVDMKSAIAAYLIAVKDFLDSASTPLGTLSFLITGDEEKEALNGTCRVLDWLQENQTSLDYCLIGEPTSHDALGDEIKVGRRGSLSAEIKLQGVQGHVAYPAKALNPVNKLLQLLDALRSRNLDDGTPEFDPSNLEITNLIAPGLNRNMIPATASATINIRFNVLHTNEQLREWITAECEKIDIPYELTFYGKSNAFISKDELLLNALRSSVEDVVNVQPKLTTGGGTSDARFISAYCPTVEFGVRNALAHHRDESVPISDVVSLYEIYRDFLDKWFQNDFSKR